MAAPAPAPQQLGANGPAWLPAPPRLYLLPHHLWWRQTRRQFLTPQGRLQVGYIRSSPQSGPARCPRRFNAVQRERVLEPGVLESPGAPPQHTLRPRPLCAF